MPVPVIWSVFTLLAPMAVETACSSAFASCAAAGTTVHVSAANTSTTLLLMSPPADLPGADALGFPLFGGATDDGDASLNDISHDAAVISSLVYCEAEPIATQHPTGHDE